MIRGALRALGRLLYDATFGVVERARLRRALRRSLSDKSQRALRWTVMTIVEGLAVAERHRVLIGPLKPLIEPWKSVHVSMATVLALLGGLHIYLAW